MDRLLLFLIINFLHNLNLQGQKKDSIVFRFKQLNESGNFKEVRNDHVSFFKNGKGDGDYYFEVAKAYDGLNRADSAFFYYQLSKENFALNNNLRKVALANLEISGLIESQNNLKENTKYFEDFWEYAINSKDTFLLAKGYNYKGRITFLDENPKIPLDHFKTAYSLFEKVGDDKMATINLMNIGVVHGNRLKNQDSSQFYYLKSLNKMESKITDFEYSNLQHDILNNLGNSLRRSKRFREALEYYKIAETLKVKKYATKTKKILYGNMDLTYYYMGDFENAYNYLYKYDSIKDIISLESQNASISEIQEKYDNEKLRADNLEIEQRRIKNRNWLMAATLALIFGTGIAILLQKNTTKKRQLAEQEVQLKQQRVDNLLKEQELVSIDAMIAGQEKERQKVAGELHDDLGSLMATIKLHFDNAKVAKQDPALQNAQKLLEEAYQKIRGIAHNKNSGVMSDQGLLLAIKKMANTITQTDALKVTVEDFGLGERLENSLELSIFRMVQELVANAIKHADASRVNIQLTQHEDNLNIIVEDNGKGFDRSRLDMRKSGMGLTNIEKRVEHLEGSFTIDSVVGKGTSILIDIPV